MGIRYLDCQLPEIVVCELSSSDMTYLTLNMEVGQTISVKSTRTVQDAHCTLHKGALVVTEAAVDPPDSCGVVKRGI